MYFTSHCVVFSICLTYSGDFISFLFFSFPIDLILHLFHQFIHRLCCRCSFPVTGRLDIIMTMDYLSDKTLVHSRIKAGKRN